MLWIFGIKDLKWPPDEHRVMKGARENLSHLSSLDLKYQADACSFLKRKVRWELIG